MEDFELAKDKVLMGAERKSMILAEDEKRMIAYHESGHTWWRSRFPAPTGPQGDDHPARHAPGLDPAIALDEKHIHSKDQAENTISVLNGRTLRRGADLQSEDAPAPATDIDKATDLARKMVCEWG
jgi:cell division protease FtsH